MGIFSRPAPAARHDLKDRPELYVPETLEPYYADALAQAQQTVRALPDTPTIQAVAEAAVAREHFDGYRPGFVGKPRPKMVQGVTSAQSTNRRSSGIVIEQYTTYETVYDPAEEAAWAFEQQFIADHGEQFAMLAAQLRESIEADVHRMFELATHLGALELAQAARARAEADAKHAREIQLNHTCPLCGGLGQDGDDIKTRDLGAGRASRVSLRACRACHNLAAVRYTELCGVDRIADGRTRLEVVDAAVRQLKGASRG